MKKISFLSVLVHSYHSYS